MTFKHKLSRRLALLFSASAVVALAMNGCEIPVATSPPVDVAQLLISPKTTTVQPNQDVMFTSVALTAQGDTAQVSVSWSATGGSVTDTSTNGKRHYGHWRNSSCGTFKVAATSHPGSKSDTASVTVTCPVVSAALSTVAVAPTSLTAGGGSATVTVTVKDANGTPMSGATVVLTATGSCYSLIRPTRRSDAFRFATGTLSTSVAGANKVAATVNPAAITQTAGVTVTSAPVSAALSTVAVAPTSLTAGGGSAAITGTGGGANGKPVSGATGVLAGTGGGDTLTQPSGGAQGSGGATGAPGSTG